MLHGLGGGGGLQQSHRAATKATAGHAAAINPGRRQRGLHQLVQLGAAHLVVIPAKRQQWAGLGQAWDPPTRPWRQTVSQVPGAGMGGSPEGVVTLHHEAAEGSVVAPAQGGCCLGRAPDLSHDVPRPPEALLAHQLAAGWGGKGSAGPPPASAGPLQMWGVLGRSGSLQLETWL